MRLDLNCSSKRLTMKCTLRWWFIIAVILLSSSIWYLLYYNLSPRNDGPHQIFYDTETRIPILLSESYSGNTSHYFQDQYFKRVLDAYRYISSNRGEKNIISKINRVPKFLLVAMSKSTRFWPSQLRHISNHECPMPCSFTRDLKEADNVDAILIHLDSFKRPHAITKILPKRNLNIPWVMLTFESPLMANKTIKLKYEVYNYFFNRTMTYRKDADVIVNHGFVVSKEDASLLPTKWRSPPLYNITSSIKYNLNETKVAAFISNCKDKSGRLKYISKLQRYINVDIYGRCGKLKCGRSMFVGKNYFVPTDKCLRKVGTSYMFYLAFENSFCKDYGSEKIYNLLYYPIVPIVYGGINYDEILPPNSYINAADYSPSELADYIRYLASHKDEYGKYLEWRNHYVASTIGGERIMCDLCTRLYDPVFYQHNVIKNFTKWYVNDSKCFKYNA